MSVKVRYYWTEDGKGEMCSLEKITTEQDTPCYHCDNLIPAKTLAVKLRTVDGEYVLHKECALKNCYQHPSEQGAHRRIEKNLQNERE